MSQLERYARARSQTARAFVLPEAVSHMATKAPEAPTRDQLIDALLIANEAAKECRDPRSPAAAVAHEDINSLLDQLVGA